MESADCNKLHTNLEEIRARWRENFDDLLHQQGTADPNACSLIQQREIRGKLSEPITAIELEEALQSTRCGKTPGQDGIPADLWKYGGQSELLRLLTTCLMKLCVSQDVKDAVIVTIKKKKGLRSEFGDHRGISLLSTAGNFLAKIILNRIEKILEEVLPESQCGFRANRSTIEMIFSFRQLQKKSHRTTSSTVCGLFSKAFDTVDRETLWKVLKLHGCPCKVVNTIKSFHEGMSGKVSICSNISDAFTINHGVKQGCVLAPSLFTLYLASILETMGLNLNKGVYLRTRSAGKRFYFGRLSLQIHNADYFALVATNAHDIQEIFDRF